jgi:hypothetical protein
MGERENGVHEIFKKAARSFIELSDWCDGLMKHVCPTISDIDLQSPSLLTSRC